ncbi:UV excision repair protein Rad23 [Phanerochaete sordida]|uniref:UV excision repair protein RAD23 n=1 Tax=Phanerochaete sordida TaxID=48140 RepID=A0A9P3GGE7_9APHY|nr:UV excision repair protein Rad23 [Phanerochaete sordida]
MKITVKTLQQKTFTLDAEPSETVADLKKKIEQEHGHALATQKLIYSGQVLGDDKTVESCNIKEKGFLVLMVAKPKAEPKPAAPTAPVAATSAAPSNPPAAAPAADAPAASTPAAAAPQPPNAPILTPAQAAPVSAAPSSRAFNDENAFVTGTELQTTVQNMMEMGFERDQVMRALRASYNNPDRAVEYLFNGVPAHLEEVAAGAQPQPPAQAPAAAAPAATPAAAPAPAGQLPPAIPFEQLPRAPAAAGQPQNLFQLAQQQQAAQPGAAGARQAGQPGVSLPGAGAGAGIDVSQLQNQPQIQHLRQLLQQNPELIQPVLQQLAEQNPGLAAMFAQNPEAIAQAIGLSAEDLEGGDELPEGAQVIHVTEEEQAAIQRLQDLGFSRQAAIEAYFACDKNEEMAANYLFESGGQFD